MRMPSHFERISRRNVEFWSQNPNVMILHLLIQTCAIISCKNVVGTLPHHVYSYVTVSDKWMAVFNCVHCVKGIILYEIGTLCSSSIVVITYTCELYTHITYRYCRIHCYVFMSTMIYNRVYKQAFMDNLCGSKWHLFVHLCHISAVV